MTRIYIVLIIILSAGLLGGLAACLVERETTTLNRKIIARYLILGVIAAACVPLFLSLVRSELLKNAVATISDKDGRPFPDVYEAWLVFSGICLIAAFSARKFIDSVSRQVLRRLDEVQETAQGAAATAATARQVAHEAVTEVEAVDEEAGAPLSPEVEIELLGEPPTEGESIPLTAIERRALMALAKRTYRTRTGIAEDGGISRNQISEVLDMLHQRKLAVSTKSPTTGGARWIITRRGEAALAQPS